MASMKIFAVFAIVLATYGSQGTFAQRGRGRGSEHGGGGHSVSKRSLSDFMQYVPWVAKSRSESPAPTDNPDISFVESRANASRILRSDSGAAPGLHPAEQEGHSVSKRSVEDARPEQDLRSLRAGGLFSQKAAEPKNFGLLSPVKGAPQTVVIVQHPGPVTLKPLLALPTTTPPPAIALSVIPVVPEVPEVPAPPAPPAVVLPAAVILPPPVTTTPPPALLLEVDATLSVKTPPPPPPPAILIAARANTAVNHPKTTTPESDDETTPSFRADGADASVALAESARNDPRSISRDKSIS